MSTSAWEEVRQRYVEERPLYEQLAQAVRTTLTERCYRAGIVCKVDSRAKDVASLVKKAMAQKCDYEKIYDKAGVRVVPIYSDWIDDAEQVVRSSFDITWEADRSKALDYDRFGYRGRHYQVQLRRTGMNELDQRIANLSCEVQIHTLAENLWSTVAHDLTYKSSQNTSDEIRRSIHRLSAILEIVDSEVHRVRDTVINQPGALETQVLAKLEQHYFRFAAIDYSR